MLNISNLDQDQQTKDSFIKSMVLFIILLAFCFLPFLAFTQSTAVTLGHGSYKKGISKIEKSIVRKQESRMAIAD